MLYFGTKLLQAQDLALVASTVAKALRFKSYTLAKAPDFNSDRESRYV